MKCKVEGRSKGVSVLEEWRLWVDWSWVEWKWNRKTDLRLRTSLLRGGGELPTWFWEMPKRVFSKEIRLLKFIIFWNYDIYTLRFGFLYLKAFSFEYWVKARQIFSFLEF